MSPALRRSLLSVLAVLLALGFRWFMTMRSISACKKLAGQSGLPADSSACYRGRLQRWAR
jgi:hypothetical protein